MDKKGEKVGIEKAVLAMKWISVHIQAQWSSGDIPPPQAHRHAEISESPANYPLTQFRTYES